MSDSSFSDVPDDELEGIYRSLTGNSSTGLLTPNIGRRKFIAGALRGRGLNVQRRWRITDCLRRVDPVGTAVRWRMAIHRLKYYVPTPNSLWHIDSGHKFIRYKGIDGKTRLILYAVCRDYGMENYHVVAYMIQHHGPGRGSVITGSSVHNSTVERTHRDVYNGVLVFYSRIFGQLEDEGNLDVLNDLHIFSLYHVSLHHSENTKFSRGACQANE